MDSPLGEGQACALGRLLDEHQCTGTVVLDISAVSDVADFFIIATARSSTHLRGVHGYVLDYLREQGIRPLAGHKRAHDNLWLLVDLGPIVVHLMEHDTRAFYELEKLWFTGRVVDYSSNSS